MQLQSSDVVASCDKEEKCRLIHKRINDLQLFLAHIGQASSEFQQNLERKVHRQIHLWEIELESGGNVKYSPGGPECQWYNSCVELVNSRFSGTYVQVGPCGDQMMCPYQRGVLISGT